MTTTITQSHDLKPTPALNVRGIRKSYRGDALKTVDFDPMPGEITVGCIVLETGRRTDARLISIVLQELSIIQDLSVLDNVLLGDQSTGQLLFLGRCGATVRRQLNDIRLSPCDLDQPARERNLAEQQLIEIARGVSRRARILVFDQPTATSSDSEISRVSAAVRWLRKAGSSTVIHKPQASGDVRTGYRHREHRRRAHPHPPWIPRRCERRGGMITMTAPLSHPSYVATHARRGQENITKDSVKGCYPANRK